MVEARKFDVKTSRVGGVAVLSVRGDIDALTAPSLTEAIAAAQAEQPSAVIVDLSDVEFLASAGMTALVTAHQQITPSAQFLVVADGPGTSRPIKLMGVDGLLALYSTSTWQSAPAPDLLALSAAQLALRPVHPTDRILGGALGELVAQLLNIGQFAVERADRVVQHCHRRAKLGVLADPQFPGALPTPQGFVEPATRHREVMVERLDNALWLAVPGEPRLQDDRMLDDHLVGDGQRIDPAAQRGQAALGGLVERADALTRANLLVGNHVSVHQSNQFATDVAHRRRPVEVTDRELGAGL